MDCGGLQSRIVIQDFAYEIHWVSVDKGILCGAALGPFCVKGKGEGLKFTAITVRNQIRICAFCLFYFPIRTTADLSRR